MPLGAVAPERAGRWIAAAGEGVLALPVSRDEPGGTRHRILVTTAAHDLTDPQGHDGRVLTAEVAVAGRVTDTWG